MAGMVASVGVVEVHAEEVAEIRVQGSFGASVEGGTRSYWGGSWEDNTDSVAAEAEALVGVICFPLLAYSPADTLAGRTHSGLELYNWPYLPRQL